MNDGDSLLLVGDVIVDVTVTGRGEPNKLRLGGITHAARGLYAQGIPYVAAAVVPEYLASTARDYFTAIGCQNFIIVGHVAGAPNVTLISDPAEIGDQEYDDLLRDTRDTTLTLTRNESNRIDVYRDALIFPGSYDLHELCNALSSETRIHIDIAYNTSDIEELTTIDCPVETVFLSTSSSLVKPSSTLTDIAAHIAGTAAKTLVFKENRGGTRVHDFETRETVKVPAQLGATVNSVGVGDVWNASYLAFRNSTKSEAAYRAAWASAAYAGTTQIDSFVKEVQIANRLQAERLYDLGGVSLCWENRTNLNLYLAAPDFTNNRHHAIDDALASLYYHNFRPFRPIIENGELPRSSPESALRTAYARDCESLYVSHLVFAIPVFRDPGTLVEIGLAQASNIPVVVYDPEGTNDNTMVIAGAYKYSSDLGTALNAVFSALSYGDLDDQ